MANLGLTNVFTPDIYQLERTDSLDAGINGAGIANRQAKELGNRTNYLKSHVDALENNSIKHRGVKIVSASYTLTVTDYGLLIVVIGNTGAVTITLPLSTTLANGDTVTIVNKSNFTVTVTKQGSSDQIETGTSIALPSNNDSATIVLDKPNLNYVVSILRLSGPTKSITFLSPNNISVGVGTSTSVAGSSFTSPNDGVTRKYKFIAKCYLSFANGNAVGALKLVNTTTSTTVDENEAGSDTTAGSITFRSGIELLFYSASVPPNTTFELQAASFVGTSEFKRIKLLIEEV